MKWSLSRSTTIALLLSPVGVLLISITRLLIISNYNTATASTIASSGGYVSTLLGSFIPVVPLLLPYFALVLLFLDRTILAILALLATALTSPAALSGSEILKIVQKDGRLYSHDAHLQVFVTFAALFLMMLTIEALTLEIRVAARTASLIFGLAIIPLVLLLYPLPFQSNFYAQHLRQPWLPAETVTLTSQQSIVGYVLSKDDDWFVILQASNRDVYFFHAGQIVNQEVCQLGSTNTERPIINLFNAPAMTPACSPTSVVGP